MKTSRINLRASAEEADALKKASRNLEEETGEKHGKSDTIRESLRRVANDKPDLFFVNRQALRELSLNLEFGKGGLQAIVDCCNEIRIDIGIEEIQSWYGKGRKDFMVEQRNVIYETTVSKLLSLQETKYPDLQIIRENVKVPDLSRIFEAAGRLIEAPSIGFQEVGVIWHCYSINRSGQVVLNPEKVEIEKNRYRAYATTPEQRSKLSRVKALCRALDSFVSSKDVPIGNIVLRGICYWDQESGRFEPSENFVLYGLIPKL